MKIQVQKSWVGQSTSPNGLRNQNPKMNGRTYEFSLARAINKGINSGSPHPTHTPLSHPPQITDMCQDSLISHKIRKAGWLNAQSFIIFMGGGGWNAPAEVGPDWFRHSPLKDCQRTQTHCHSYFSCPGGWLWISFLSDIQALSLLIGLTCKKLPSFYFATLG